MRNRIKIVALTAALLGLANMQQTWAAGEAVYPFPESGGTANRLVGKLSWCGDSSIRSYDVYFGTPGNLQFVDRYFITSVSFDDLAVSLDQSTLPAGNYQWRVDTRDSSGARIVTGEAWDVTIPAEVPATPVTTPNILYILVDDMGYADVDANIDDAVLDLEFTTPHIDSIFTGGTRFEAGFVANSVCAPSRAGLLTGRSGSRHGFETNPPSKEQWLPGSRIGLAPGQATIPDVLKTIGYKTFGLGKWHLGGHPALFHPNVRGFDEWYGFLGGARTYYQITDYDQSNSLEHNGVYVTEPSDLYTTDFLTDQALAYISDQTTNNPNQSWFMYLSYNAPHGPMDCKRTDLDRIPLASWHSTPRSRAVTYSVMETDGSIVDYSTTDKNELRQVYGAMVVNLDDNVGRLLDLLDTLNIADDTLIVFHSDNGGPENDNWSINNPLKGGKGSLWEGGVRVPFAIRWPGTIPGGQVFGHDCPVSSLDMMPTFAAVSGADQVENIRTDGLNLMPLLTGQVSTTAPRQLYWRRSGTRRIATRSGDWKYYYERDKLNTYLFDHGSTSSESTSQAGSQPDVVTRLEAEYAAYEDTIPTPFWKGLLAIITYDLDDAVRGQPYTMQLNWNEELEGPASGSVTWSVPVGKPDWLSINPVTGMLSGTPGPTAPEDNYLQLHIVGDDARTSTYNVPLRVIDAP